MSLQLESTPEEIGQPRLVEIKPSRKVIVARPGSRAGIALHVEAGHRLYVRLEVEGLGPNIASYYITPQQAPTPFTSRLELHISPGAIGVYPFKLAALDMTGNGYGAIKY